MKLNTIIIIFFIVLSSCSNTGINPQYTNNGSDVYVIGGDEFDTPVGRDGKINMEVYVYEMSAFAPDTPTYRSNYILVKVVGLWVNEELQAPANELGYFVIPPKHKEFTDILYNDFPKITKLENNPNDIGTANVVIDSLSFGYNNVRGVRLRVHFRARYDTAKYVSSPGAVRDTVSTSVLFLPHDVDWWAEEGEWRTRPGVSGSVDITALVRDRTR